MSKQSQKSGDNSVQVQADVVNLGVSLSEVKDVCALVYEANFPRLQEAAAEEAAKKSRRISWCSN